MPAARPILPGNSPAKSTTGSMPTAGKVERLLGGVVGSSFDQA